MIINYKLLSNAIDFFKYFEYQMVDVPWEVSSDSILKTVNTLDLAYPFNNQYLVGSAEQSFLELIKLKKLPENKNVMAVTPCFRNELITPLHSKYFMKLELFSWSSKSYPESHLNVAKKFFQSVAGYNIDEVDVEGVPHWKGSDLYLNNIEIGSYLKYNKDGIYWSCGTGLALPRFEQALNNV